MPDAEWDRVVALGFDAVWLMGVWERSPAGIALATVSALLAELRRVLPDHQRRTMSAHPIRSGAIGSRDDSVDGRIGQPRERRWPGAACGSSSILCRMTWRRITPGG